MIEAKPLNPKDLGHLRSDPDAISEAPKLDRNNTEIIPESDRKETELVNLPPSYNDHLIVESEPTLKSLRNKKKNLILLIIKAQPGLKSAEITQLMLQFCRVRNYSNRHIHEASVAALCKSLIDEGKLNREQINGVYRYFIRRD